MNVGDPPQLGNFDVQYAEEEDASSEFDLPVVEKPPKFLKGIYLVGDLLGEGSFAKVKEVLHKDTLMRRAVKIIRLKPKQLQPKSAVVEQAQKEIRILRKLKGSEHVTEIFDVFENKEKEKLYVVLEYCVGSLQQLIERSPRAMLPEFQAHYYFVQLINGIEFLHSRGVIHKDIKPGNLLLNLQGTLKISDFGVAEQLSPFQRGDRCFGGKGTPMFQAPEIVGATTDEIYGLRGKPVDIWSCGVTLYNFVSGTYPFDQEQNIVLLMQQIAAEGDVQLPESVNPEDELAVLLKGMLRKNPGPGEDEILRDADGQMMGNYRYTIEDIRRSSWFRRSHRVIPDEIVHIDAVNTVPAHRPLTVQHQLGQLYGSPDGEDEEA